MPLGWITAVDYLEFDADPSSNLHAITNETNRPNLGIRQHKPYLKALGQTSNTAAGNVANQPLGTAAIPAIAINVIGTVTVSNSLITANSFIIPFCKKVGTDASTARGPVVWIDSMGAGTVTFGVKAQGVAIAVSTYVIQFLIIN